MVLLKYSMPQDKQTEINGLISAVKTSDGTVRIFGRGNRSFTVIVDPNSTVVTDETGNRKDINYLHRGFTVSTVGIIKGDGPIVARNIKVSEAPAIIVYSPQSNSKIGNLSEILGEARIYSRQLNYAVSNSKGAVVGSGMINVSGGIGVYSPFSGKLEFGNPNTATGTIDVFQIGQSGEEQDRVSIPVIF